MNRRTLLGALAAGGAAGVAGCFDWGDDETETPTPGVPSPTTPTPTDRETPTPDPAERFDAVVDLREEYDVDDTGDRPIDDAFRAAAGDDTLVQLPPGTYKVAEMLVLERVENFGVVGTGTSRSDVRVVHPPGFSDRFLNVRAGRDCLVGNLTIDQTRDRETNSGVVLLNEDGVRVVDLEVAGFTPSRDQGSTDLIVQVTDSGGEGTVRRFTSTGGGEVGVYPASYPGFFSGPQHRGVLRLVDCHLERCGSNGLYASRTPGDVRVMGGLFRNNDVAQVRVSGEGSFVRGARIVVDTDDVENVRGSYEGVRGLWWEGGERTATGGYVSECEFVCRSANGRRALLQVDGTAGGMTVRDSSFRVTADNYYAVFARRPGSSDMGGTPERPWGIALENVRIDGEADEETAVRLVGRPGSVIADAAVAQRGADQDGVSLLDSAGSRIVRSDVVAARYPVVVEFGRSVEHADCALRLIDVGQLRSLTLDPPEEDLVELAGAANGGGDYCLTPDAVPFDGDRVALAGLTDEDGVYLLGVDDPG